MPQNESQQKNNHQNLISGFQDIAFQKFGHHQLALFAH